jgi:pimeloyl-ACP methyl ester carboxylesterase
MVAPGLTRRTLVLSDGRRVGVATGGEATGVPLVLAHGYLADGLLYAPMLVRLVREGFRVVAVDTAGPVGTVVGSTVGDGARDAPEAAGAPAPGPHRFLTSARTIGRVLDELGIDRALLVGHSMGGRLMSELAADQPDRALGLVLVDAAVGASWDRLVGASRLFPPLLAGWGGLLLTDLLVTFPVVTDQRQAAALARTLVPTVYGNARHPWRIWGPLIALLRSGPSCTALDRIGETGIPTAVLHGEGDLGVPLASARDAAARTGADLVVVHQARHSWLLKDVGAFPAVLADLWAGRFGAAVRGRVGEPDPHGGRADRTRPTDPGRRSPNGVRFTWTHSPPAPRPVAGPGDGAP